MSFEIHFSGDLWKSKVNI